MIGQIADDMKRELGAKLRDTNYLSIMIDGDTDISTTECEIVYVRHSQLEDGKPLNKLVGQQAVQHANATGK